MRTGRPKKPLDLSAMQRRELRTMAQSRTLPHATVSRARLVLMAADGASNSAIAATLGLSRATVGKWRRRFLAYGLEGLDDAPRPGRPRSVSDEQIALLIKHTLETPPADGTHWSCRSIAAHTGLAKSTVNRIWRAFGLQPHRQRHFKLSTDPYFIEKVRDVVGLYLNPPDKALVLCVDEKSQVQALDRTQPLLPMGWGYLEGVTHDYVRHGTTTLCAALEVANGRVLSQCKARHRHQEFLQFLRHIDANVPADLDIHLILDNYSTHKHAKVKRWLAKRKRYHLHFTPTYASWLNQVEIWFNLITQKAIRRGSFPSVKHLVAKIDDFVQQYNRKAKPFTWTATADSILEKLKRLCEQITGTQH